jgi:hypothetical protein
MKRTFFVIVFAALAALSNLAFAQTCPGGTTQVTQVTQLVGGNTVCARRGPDRWQSYHQGANSGPLLDYKKGPADPVDPTETTLTTGATWSAQNGANSNLTHNYGAGGTYTWVVCSAAGGGAPYTLVSNTGGTLSGVSVLTGQSSGCP